MSSITANHFKSDSMPESMLDPTQEIATAFIALKQSLRSFVRKRLADPNQVDDILHEVFIKALVALQSGQQIRNLTAWLYAATRTAIVDYYRANKMDIEILDDELAAPEQDDFLKHQELAQCLLPFMEQLEPRYRNTLVATEIDGLTMRTLAQAEGVSLSAIKSRAARGRAMLREKVLACCQVELQAGLVSDYWKHPESSEPQKRDRKSVV